MREPAARLPPVDAEGLEAAEEILRQRGRPPLEVVQDEHPDAPRLAETLHAEDGPPDPACGLAQGPHDGLEFLGRPGAEEGQGDVQVLARDDAPAARELPSLPRNQLLDRLLGQAECTEEP
jgi:hypothetical protein